SLLCFGGTNDGNACASDMDCAGTTIDTIAVVAVDDFATTSASFSQDIDLDGSVSNRLLVVAIASEAGTNGGLVNDITFDGEPMIPATTTVVGGSTLMRVHLYYLTDDDLPGTGTYSLDVTLSSNQG